jgi:hypothetical protein
MTDVVELTIVMPCLNEAETLAACIQKARLGIQRSGVRGEIGALALLAGVILLGAAVLQWKSAHFGRLDYAVTMRWVIPGATLTALGFQTILSSFFVSILGMKHRV